MATIPSNYTGFQTSSPGTRIYPGGLVTCSNSAPPSSQPSAGSSCRQSVYVAE